MHSINPKDKTERENYKLLTGSIIPRPIAFVTTLSEDGTLNGAPFSYFNIVSAGPPLISLAVQRSGEKQKDTARNILNKKEFVVHLVGEDNVDKVNQTAASLPATESEVSLAGMTPIDSKKIIVPGVVEAKMRFECKLVEHVEFGENGRIQTDLIIGQVVHYHLAKSIYDKENDYIHAETLAAVSRLAGNNYAKIGEISSLERPK